MIMYFIYATFLGWLIMILINYHFHKKYISTHKEKFFDVLTKYRADPKSVKPSEKMAFIFTPELIEKREFIKYLNLGKFKYILLDTTQILFSFIVILLISFILEFLPFTMIENIPNDIYEVLQFILIGYIICILDAYTKILKYDKIICQWDKDKCKKQS
ncbi:MAG: hypothetical protein PF638_10050 [Candidatus Delongbacteria bacterium]|jgi:pilus assembly protein TadC|nr:hypothetical protein [Candidatus Delongbacteria bacterium]